VLQLETVMFRLGFRALLIVSAAALITNPVGAGDAADKIDASLLEKLQGEWNPVSTTFDGKPFTSPAGKATAVFEGRAMSIRLGDRVVGRLEIRHLVAEGGLGHIDYEIRDPTGNTIRTKQLFKLDGDTLTTCVRSPPGERPTELASKPGSKHLLTVSQRKKKETQESRN